MRARLASGRAGEGRGHWKRVAGLGEKKKQFGMCGLKDIM